MKLLRARVTNFRCIDDSTWVEFGDVTCFVGKNESGKTAFLQALQKSNSASDDSNFSIMDYPRKGYSKYKQIHETSPHVPLEIEFELTPEEIASIEMEFGVNIFKSYKVTRKKDYKNQSSWVIDIDENAFLNYLLTQASLTYETAGISTASNCKEAILILEAKSDNPPAITSFLEILRQQIQEPVQQRIGSKYLERLQPAFFYFDDYSIMPGAISIPHLRSLIAGKTLTEDYKAFLAFLEIAGVKLTDLETQADYERRKADLEAASISISDEVFAFWSQNKELEVELDLSDADPTQPPPFNSGKIFRIRIRNQRHRVTVPFDKRSKGFVWFFSFLSYFSKLESSRSDLILLLDEPGLSLHAKAQSDFLRFIDERLAPTYQVVYTTHSPFMINPWKLQRVRTVQDIDNQGTVISDDVLRNDRDTIFPLQAALGYDLAQNLFIGPNCLLVEGPSDIIYLQMLSDLLISKGKTGLDERWVVVPVGGADKVCTFVSLLGGNKLNIAVLMDVSSKDAQRIRSLQENSLLKHGNLIKISDITSTKEADIEDLFDPLYCSSTQATYVFQTYTPWHMGPAALIAALALRYG